MLGNKGFIAALVVVPVGAKMDKPHLYNRRHAEKLKDQQSFSHAGRIVRIGKLELQQETDQKNKLMLQRSKSFRRKLVKPSSAPKNGRRGRSYSLSTKAMKYCEMKKLRSKAKAAATQSGARQNRQKTKLKIAVHTFQKLGSIRRRHKSLKVSKEVEKSLKQTDQIVAKAATRAELREQHQKKMQSPEFKEKQDKKRLQKYSKKETLKHQKAYQLYMADKAKQNMSLLSTASFKSNNSQYSSKSTNSNIPRIKPLVNNFLKGGPKNKLTLPLLKRRSIVQHLAYSRTVPNMKHQVIIGGSQKQKGGLVSRTLSKIMKQNKN